MFRIVLMLIAALGIIACGGDDTDEIFGIWKGIVEGEIAIFTFDNYGRCTLTEGGDAHDGTYFVDGNLLQLNFDGKITVVTFSINVNLMTWVLTDNGEQRTIIFERGL